MIIVNTFETFYYNYTTDFIKNKNNVSNELTENEKVVAVKLRALNELYEMKALSEDEFEKQKLELLAQLHY